MKRRVALAVGIALASAGCNLTNLLSVGTRNDLAAPNVPLVGQIVDPDGKPAADISVSAFKSDELTAGLIGNVGAGLIGNVGAGLIGNVGAGLIGNARGGYRIQGVDLKTDSSGRFVFNPDADGNFNLEAIRDSSAKAWKLKLPLTRTGTQSIVLTLSPPGAIEGQLLPTSEATSVVWIPGSTYWVYPDKQGKFRFEGLPAGKFELMAAREGFEQSGIPNADKSDPIQVKSGQTTSVNVTLKAKQSASPTPSASASAAATASPAPTRSPSPSPTHGIDGYYYP
jgi:hypothetical protein